MKNIRIIILILLVGFISCRKPDNHDNHATLVYQKDLKQFPSYMVDFFPDTIAGIYSTAQTVDTTNKCIYYCCYDLQPKNTLNLEKSLEKKCLENYNASDTGLVTIISESILEWDNSKEVYYKTLLKNNTLYYPVPFFEKDDNLDRIGIKSEDIFSNKNISGLSSDFVIYVLESKSGIYWKGLKPNKYMPDDWKNGYSKGICINHKKGLTIYWLIIW